MLGGYLCCLQSVSRSLREMRIQPSSEPLPATPQSGPATPPDCPSGHPLPRIMYKNPPFIYKDFRKPSIYIDLRQSEHFPWRCKTLMGAFQWPNSGKSRVQHMRSKGRAVFRNPPGPGLVGSSLQQGHPRPEIVPPSENPGRLMSDTNGEHTSPTSDWSSDPEDVKKS